jgi:hypothetical protein
MPDDYTDLVTLSQREYDTLIQDSTLPGELLEDFDHTEDTVTIPRWEYAELKKESQFLEALRAHGCDNWDGWSEAAREVYEND